MELSVSRNVACVPYSRSHSVFLVISIFFEAFSTVRLRFSQFLTKHLDRLTTRERKWWISRISLRWRQKGWRTLHGGHFIAVHIRIFDEFFSSLANSSVFLVPFNLLRAVEYSLKRFRVSALNSAQLLVSILRSACMQCNGTKETATFTTEEVQNRIAIFTAAILRNKEAFLWPQPRQRSAKLRQDSNEKLQHSMQDLVRGNASQMLTDMHDFTVLMTLLRVRSNH